MITEQVFDAVEPPPDEDFGDVEVLDEQPGDVDDDPLRPPPTPTGVMDSDLLPSLRRLDQLKQELARLKAGAKTLSPEIQGLEAKVIEMMITAGVDSLTVDGRTASIREATFGSRPKDVSPEEFYSAFEEAGADWAELVQPNVNGNTLRSYLVDWEQNHGPLDESLPPSLRDRLTVTRRHTVGFTAGPKTRRTARRAATRGGG